MVSLQFGKIEGLPQKEWEQLQELQRVFTFHQMRNLEKEKYYNGKISLEEVNLGIALPHSLNRLEVGCAWGAKTVDVLAGRSMFDGFVTETGAGAEEMREIMRRNRLVAEYNKAIREELKYGAAFAAVSGTRGDARVRFYSPNCAAAIWNSQKGRIDCGFVFESPKDESQLEWSPEHVTFHTEDAIWMLDKEGGRWKAAQYPHSFGQPLMVPFVWDATSEKPFGQSRLKEPIRRLIQGYVRTVANASIGLEFATSPQKYIIGVSDEQYDNAEGKRFMQYVGSIMMATTNPETGEKPTFGQLQQGNIEPHVQMMRLLATQFSAASGLTVTDTGVVNDANPTSSDAILAQSQTLVQMAEQLNAGNADALYTLSQLALAVELDVKTLDDLPEECRGIIAHFKNPAMPSVAVTTDAAIKIASAREGFAGTDTFLEMIGFSQADIRRIRAQESRMRGDQILKEEMENADIGEGVAGVHREDVTDQPDSGIHDAGMDK